MTRAVFVIVAVLVAVAGLAAKTGAVEWWMPLRQVSQQAFVGHDGTVVPQYQWRYIRDRGVPSVCLLVLTHEGTGQFAITAVPGEACPE